MNQMIISFPGPQRIELVQGAELSLSFPAPQPIVLQVEGIQGPPGAGGGVSDGDKGGIVVSGSGAVWTVKAGSITDLMLGASAIALFAAASHTHIIANVTGLQAALDGKAAAVHSHLLAAGATDVTITAANLNTLDDGTDTTLHFHAADRARGNHTGSQLAATISDLTEAAQDAVGAMVDATLVYVDGTPALKRAPISGHVTIADGSNAAALGSFTKAQLNAAVSDGDPLYVGDVTTNATHTGEVTGSTALTIAPLAVTSAKIADDAVGNDKLANMAFGTIKARVTAGTGNPENATGTEVTALLDTFTSGAKGLVPASGGGTVNFLRADGTFATPAGGGGGTPGGASGELQFNNAGAFGGAADVEIEGGQLRLPAIAIPAAPAAGGVKLFAHEVAGRPMPTFMGPSGLEKVVQPHFGRGRFAMFKPAGNNGAALGETVLGLAIATTGTRSTANVSTTNRHTRMARVDYLVTVAAITAVAGFRAAALQWTLGASTAGDGGFHMALIWGPATGVATTTSRAFAGMLGSVAAPTDVQPSSLLNICGMGWDAADANIQFMHNDGAGTATKIDLGASFPVPVVDRTSVYRIELYAPPGTTQSLSYQVTDLVSGAVATGTVTTDLPATSQLLAPYNYMSVGGTSSVVGIAVMGLTIESDY